MAETQTNITDSQLLTELKNSLIDESQKKELIPLIPKMTAEERIQLMGLIEQSTEEIGKAQKKYDENMDNITKAYNKEVKRIDQEYTKKTTKKLEEIDSKKVTGELAQMETEILETAKTKKELSARQKLGNAKKHTLRNFMLTLILLAALVAGILYGINYLNTL
jgi:thiol:disulfide interchange protein